MRFFLIALAVLPLWASERYEPVDFFHEDHRQTPKIQYNPDFETDTFGERAAWDYLEANLDTYGIENTAQLNLILVQHSLLGSHYTFQQHIDGIPVELATIVISIDYDGKVYMVGNNTYPVAAHFQSKTVQLSQDDAYDVAWFDMGVHGDLLQKPAIELKYLPEGDSFRLAYVVTLGVEAPFGYWEHKVDATDGRVLNVKSAAVSRKPVEMFPAYDGWPVFDREAAFSRHAVKELKQQALRKARSKAQRATGMANLFDPDPRTTLLDDSLQDGSPASAFTAAYLARTLTDITENAGTFSLVGPWVQIIDFESPATAPSTTTDGDWGGFTRGNNAFNDAMTYFHVDQNQRYIQSLGFTGATGIQEVSIGADSDGLNGGDNSHYLPGSNRMAFGHGCVDDNEDQFVILHEYGHALHTSAGGANWSGGDTGGMGEGFGDYWAGSYRYRTPNGPNYHPEWAFPWDGHGDGNQCWAGRVMNLTSTSQYQPGSSYGPHATVGGVLSDELWSTPLFQALVDLLGQGRAHDEMDQIVLQAFFGMPAAPTMRQMANQVIAAASSLYPGGPHAGVYTDKFLVHNIIDVPRAIMEAGAMTVVEPGSNGVADPGETISFKVNINNTGTLATNNVSAVLSTSNANVNITNGMSTYPDIGIGGSVQNVTDFVVELDAAMTCGEVVSFDLTVTYDNVTTRETTVMNLTLPTGVPQGASEAVTPNLPINDNATITSDIVISGTGANVTANFNLDMNITHTYQGDILMTLESPAGTVVTLHNRTGGTVDNIIGNYPGTLTPNQALSAFLGQPLDGTWTLSINDNANNDTGNLNGWGINDVTGYDCEASDPCGTLTQQEVFAIWMDTTPGYDYNNNGRVDIMDLINFDNLGCTGP